MELSFPLNKHCNFKRHYLIYIQVHVQFGLFLTTQNSLAVLPGCIFFVECYRAYTQSIDRAIVNGGRIFLVFSWQIREGDGMRRITV